MRVLVLWPLFLAMSLSGFAGEQNSSPPKEPSGPSALELPSFSIFGLSAADLPEELSKPYSEAELKAFIADVEKRESQHQATRTERPYFIVPFIFFKSRSLFSKESWTDEEIKEGQQISDFLATYTGKSDLRIERSDQASFRHGLVRLRDWFAAMCA